MTNRVRRTPVIVACAIAIAVLSACGSTGKSTAAASTAAASSLTLTSTAFADGQPIPRKFTCQGVGVSPELTWSGAPAGTKSLALLVVDPDAPVPDGFTHWVLAGIDPAAGTLAEGTTVGTPGANSSGGSGYTGPCPPSGKHHYIFTLYALGTPLGAAPDRAAIEAAGAKALGKAVLTGTYEQS